MEGHSPIENLADLVHGHAEPKQLVTTALANTSEVREEGKYLACFYDLMDAERTGKGDASIVHDEMEKNLNDINVGLVKYLETGLQKLCSLNPQYVDSIYVLLARLCSHFLDFELGDRSGNIEIAIAGYQIVLSYNLSKENYENCAIIHRELGAAYLERVYGDHAENIESAIAAFKQILSLSDKFNFPVLVAEAMSALGASFFLRIKGFPKDNIEQSIYCYKQALEIYSQVRSFVSWAFTMQSLAVAYYFRIDGDKEENQEQAILNFKSSLLVIDRSDRPIDWAKIMRGLAELYSKRIRGDLNSNLQEAIFYFNESLEIFSQSIEPLEWSRNQKRLASLYANPAIREYKQAIYLLGEVYNFLLKRKIHLDVLAEVTFELGQLHHLVGQLKSARFFFKDAQRLYQRLDQPEQEIAVMATLGNLEMQMGDTSQANRHLQFALDYYQTHGRAERIAEVKKLLGFLAPASSNLTCPS